VHGLKVLEFNTYIAFEVRMAHDHIGEKENDSRKNVLPNTSEISLVFEKQPINSLYKYNFR